MPDDLARRKSEVLNNKPISPEDELADALEEMARDIALIEPNPEDWDAYCGLAIIYYQANEGKEAGVYYPDCQQRSVNDYLKGQAESEKTMFELRQSGTGEGS